MAEPRITVLVPIKAFHPPYLEQAIDSVFAQTSPRWELLLIAERSVLSEVTTVLAPRLEDERVRLIANEGRKLSGNYNTGMRAATTEFMSVLLGDDLWAPETIAVLERSIEDFPAVDFFYSSRRYIDEDGRPISRVYPARESFALTDFVNGSPVKHLLCWRRELALSIGGLDERLTWVGPDDYDFPWTMAEAGARFRAIPECLYVYRDHREMYRLTTHVPLSTHCRELRRILRKHGVDRRLIDSRVEAARRTYLRQCLYRSRLDRFVKQRLGHDARLGWRETYERS